MKSNILMNNNDLINEHFKYRQYCVACKIERLQINVTHAL